MPPVGLIAGGGRFPLLVLEAARSLGETLGNDAKWYAYGNGFLAVNMFGVWFAVEDVPGWNWGFYQQGSETRLRVME